MSMSASQYDDMMGTTNGKKPMAGPMLKKASSEPYTSAIHHLLIELTNGNDGRGSKWFSSAKVRKEIEEKLRSMRLERQPFDVPVNVHITRILGKNQRLWDADSILRGNSKELIDALVAVGWFHDDGPKYIKAVTADQDATQRDNGPSVIVKVTAYETSEVQK